MPKTISATLISRRCFLRNLSLVAAGSLLAACAVEQERTPLENRVDPIIGEAQVPRPYPTASVVAQEGDTTLAGFLSLSALLTGVDRLDPALGQFYLQNLQESSEFEVTVGELLDQAQAGFTLLPDTLEGLESSGIFENEATRMLADRITEMWYTGVYNTAEGEQAVATYVDALAWTTLAFTKPMSVCGSYRFWTEPPEAAID